MVTDDERDDWERKMRAFVVLTVTKAIRDTCEIARGEWCTKDETIAAFANLADMVERAVLDEVAKGATDGA